jgi:hypothetical protein
VPALFDAIVLKLPDLDVCDQLVPPIDDDDDKIKIITMMTTNLMLICICTHSVEQPPDTGKYYSMLLMTKGQWLVTLLSVASKHLLL